MRHARVARVITVALLVLGTALPTAACLDRGSKCTNSTAKFPTSGVVQSKSNPERNCYMLYIKRTDNLNTEIVRVNRFRYTHVEIRQTVTYAVQPTD